MSLLLSVIFDVFLWDFATVNAFGTIYIVVVADVAGIVV